MKKTMVFLAAVTAAMLATGCGEKKAEVVATDSNTSGVVKETATSEYYDPVGAYQHSEKAQYEMRVGGESYNVTKYVTECVDGLCKFQSDILMEVFGYTDKKADEEFITYTKDGNQLQLSIGGNDIIYNGAVSKVSSPMNATEDGKQIVIPADFMLCLGEYTSYSVSVSPDEGTLIYEPIADAPVLKTEEASMEELEAAETVESTEKGNVSENTESEEVVEEIADETAAETEVETESAS